MSNHSRLDGEDLHRPTREIIRNTTGTQLVRGAFVSLSNPISNDIIPVSRLATVGETFVGFNDIKNIGSNLVSTVFTFGRIEPFDTTNLVAGQDLRVATGGLSLEVTTGVDAVARVIIGGSTSGVIFFDGLGGVLSSSASGVGLINIPFASSDWTTNADGTLRISLVHGLDTNNLNLKWYQSGYDGDIYVPWESTDVNTIMGCIPAGEAFTGEIRASGFVQGRINTTGTGAEIDGGRRVSDGGMFIDLARRV